MGRRSVAGLAVVVACCVVLGVLGLGVESKLAPLSLGVPGTGAAQAEELAAAHFGDSSPSVVLLRGPARAVDRQGIRLVRTLRHERDATVISPWDRGAVAGLRPAPRKALIVVDYHVPLATAIRDDVPALEKVLAAKVNAPVDATQSGYASVSKALQDESLSAT